VKGWRANRYTMGAGQAIVFRRISAEHLVRVVPVGGRAAAYGDQRSASGAPIVRKPEPPTAMQTRTVGHETPARKGNDAFSTIGWSCQAVPSKRSATSEALGLVESPTAVHAPRVAQETAKSVFATAPVHGCGFGADWIAQTEYRQLSASVAPPSALVIE
jgi:hypothetical protein